MVVDMEVLGPFLTEEEVAHLLDIDTETVWQYARTGVIPASIKVGSTDFWRRIDIRRWYSREKE